MIGHILRGLYKHTVGGFIADGDYWAVATLTAGFIATVLLILGFW